MLTLKRTEVSMSYDHCFLYLGIFFNTSFSYYMGRYFLERTWTRGLDKRKTQKDPELIKYCVFILICLNFSHLQNTLHLMQYTYREVFSHCSKQFLNSSILMPFKCLCCFLFHLFHIGKPFPPFEDFFHPGKQKKVTRGEIG